MMFQVTGIDTFRKSLEGQMAAMHGRINAAYREFITNILTELVENTPQWSGDLAASWRVRAEGLTSRSGGSSTTGFKRDPIERPPPFFKGDEPAIVYALSVNSEVIQSIRYNTRVTIFNDNPTAEIITQSDIVLRPGNFIPGDVMAVAHTIAKYGNATMRLSTG
jgi:hypothetical protein